MYSGSIELWRRLLYHPIWLDEKFTRGQAWVDLLLLAKERESQERIRGIAVTVPRGYVCMSHVELAGRWKWSRGKVIRFLTELETLQQIEQHKSNVTTLIEIVNFPMYQSGGTANSTADRTANGQQTDSKRTAKNPAEKQLRLDGEEDPPEATRGPPPCPVKRIVSLYHTILPELPKCRAVEAVAPNIRSRWREKKVRQNLEWWTSLFENRIRTSDFLMGRKTDWNASLQWIVGPVNLGKILNGQYENKGNGAGPAPQTYGQHLDDERRRKVRMLMELENEQQPEAQPESRVKRIDAP